MCLHLFKWKNLTTHHRVCRSCGEMQEWIPSGPLSEGWMTIHNLEEFQEGVKERLGWMAERKTDKEKAKKTFFINEAS